MSLQVQAVDLDDELMEDLHDWAERHGHARADLQALPA
jgi:hypothetical protein